MSGAGFTFVGTVAGLAQVQKRDQTMVPGFYNLIMEGVGEYAGQQLKAKVNSHKKAEDGGGLHPYWSVLTSNQGTGVPIEVKGWRKEDDDGWGNAKVENRVNGARVYDGAGGQPAPAQAAATQPQASSGAPPAQAVHQPPAQGGASAEELGASLQRAIQHGLELEATMAVAAVLPDMPQDIRDDTPAVRGAWIRQQAAKVLTIARLLVRDGAGPTVADVRGKQAEEKPAVANGTGGTPPPSTLEEKVAADPNYDPWENPETLQVPGGDPAEI